jgi:hypothetical protein
MPNGGGRFCSGTCQVEWERNEEIADLRAEVERLRDFEESVACMLGYLIPETGEMASHATMLESIGHLKYAASFYAAWRGKGKSHDMWKDGDEGVPPAILDSNGQVCLDVCKRCGKAEIELIENPVCAGRGEGAKLSGESLMRAVAPEQCEDESEESAFFRRSRRNKDAGRGEGVQP